MTVANVTNGMDEALLARVRTAGERIAPLADEIERGRRLPAAAVSALVDAGVFKLAVPRALGGGEADLPTLLTTFEILARADGSAGWTAMIGAASGLMSIFLDDETARRIYGPADAISCGVFAPLGRATRVAGGGLRVSGRWPFGSGCEHSQWRMGGVLVFDGEQPELLPGTTLPHVRCVLFSASETEIIDSWDVSGLRGSGSHDIAVRDVTVPAERCFSFLTDKPRGSDAPLYKLPFFGVLASGVAAVALGIARAAIDGLVALATKKTIAGSRRTIAQRELVQLEVARADARVRAARAFLFAAVANAAGKPASDVSARAQLRLAACH
ncbi:MAG TPA: acyl-CoA dehydrogenase family protein, partial [Polyangia bacterium]|nr:acyl-CoA dehydrogenase family protein [Polyangia bacterium]